MLATFVNQKGGGFVALTAWRVGLADDIDPGLDREPGPRPAPGPDARRFGPAAGQPGPVPADPRRARRPGRGDRGRRRHRYRQSPAARRGGR
ncbi:hypothetical protein DBR41_26505 [Pseudomonas sp. HMWF010]|nr:hypothetical protein DBR21_16280 [Caulobacter sp. HMWF009]PTT06207.1 hypothetical protein DBR10_13500 [Caulobacter sp. HMWF025]PTT75256.1 hypothetical protein DBR41_26505 [Pseudomonas sp. HMWF010]